MSKKRDLFEGVFELYRDQIYSYLVQSVGRVDAEDLVQEVFIKVFKNINKFNRAKSEAAWIYTIARNTLYDFLRKKKSKGNYEVCVDDYVVENTVGESKDLDESIAVRNAANKLKKDRREVIVLHYFQGLSYEEISRIIKSPINTVKSRISRAKSDLKELLK